MLFKEVVISCFKGIRNTIQLCLKCVNILIELNNNIFMSSKLSGMIILIVYGLFITFVVLNWIFELHYLLKYFLLGVVVGLTPFCTYVCYHMFKYDIPLSHVFATFVPQGKYINFIKIGNNFVNYVNKFLPKTKETEGEVKILLNWFDFKNIEELTNFIKWLRDNFLENGKNFKIKFLVGNVPNNEYLQVLKCTNDEKFTAKILGKDVYTNHFILVKTRLETILWYEPLHTPKLTIYDVYIVKQLDELTLTKLEEIFEKLWNKAKTHIQNRTPQELIEEFSY